MTNENFQKEEYLRMIRWMTYNTLDLYVLANVLEGVDSKTDTFIKALQIARDNRFYYLLPFLFRKIRETLSGEQAMNSVILNRFDQNLDPSICDDLIRELRT